MASTATPTETVTERTLLFRVGGQVYGCDIQVVREIVPYRKATRLPGSPAWVQGLINVRGTIVTVLDLGVRLDPAAAPVQSGSIVMVEFGAKTVGLVVEEVMDVRGLSTAARTSAAGDEDRAVVRDVGRVDETVVIALDVQALIKQVLLT